MPRPPRSSSAQYVPSSDITDMDEGCQITNALQEHALALQQMMSRQWVVDLSDPRCLEPSTSPGEMNGTCLSSLSLRNSLRSGCVSAPTFIENLKYVNAEVSQHCEGVKGQCWSGDTKLDTKVAYVDDYPWKTSEMLDKGAPKCVNNIPQVGAWAVLVTKQEPWKLVTLAQVAAQNQQELSASVQRSLEVSM